MTDDQGYPEVSAHNPVLQTPNLDALYNQSLRLTDYHVAHVYTDTGAVAHGIDTARNGRGSVSNGRLCSVRKFPNGQLLGDAGTPQAFWEMAPWRQISIRPQDRGFEERLVSSSSIPSVPAYWGNDYFDDVYISMVRNNFTGYCTDVFTEAKASEEIIEGKKTIPLLPCNQHAT